MNFILHFQRCRITYFPDILTFSIIISRLLPSGFSWSAYLCVCVCVCKHTTARGVGRVAPRNFFLQFRSCEIVFMGRSDALRRPDNRGSHAYISTFPAYHALQHWFQLPNCSLILQTTPFVVEAYEIKHSFGRTESALESWEDSEEIFLHSRFAAILQVLVCGIQMRTVCMWALHGCPPSNW